MRRTCVVIAVVMAMGCVTASPANLALRSDKGPSPARVQVEMTHIPTKCAKAFDLIGGIRSALGMCPTRRSMRITGEGMPPASKFGPHERYYAWWRRCSESGWRALGAMTPAPGRAGVVQTGRVNLNKRTQICEVVIVPLDAVRGARPYPHRLWSLQVERR